MTILSTPTAAPTRGAGAGQPRLLLIDDDPHLLDGLRRRLRWRYDVSCAEGGPQALHLIDTTSPFAIAVCDMRMPGMDGVAVLKALRQRTPDTVRLLLTGYVDINNAIAAVNEGHLFRFLCKPVDHDILGLALDDAAAQHRLITAEQELQEQTLRGAIQTLTEILSLANPVAFARALRLKALTNQLLDSFEVTDRWQIEIASMLSQLGAATIPDGILARVESRKAIDPADQQLLDRIPHVSERLLAGIPRLEGVRRIIGEQVGPTVPADLSLGGKVLRMATDLDNIEGAGLSRDAARAFLLRRYGKHASQLLGALVGSPDGNEPADTTEMVEVETTSLPIGAILHTDIHTEDGRLVVRRGQEITPGLLERLTNFSSRHQVTERVIISRPSHQST